MHRELTSETFLSCSRLRAAEPAKRAGVEDIVHTSYIMKDILQNRHELVKMRKELYRIREDREAWRRLFK